MLRIIVLTAVLLIILQNQVVLFTIQLVNLIILLRRSRVRYVSYSVSDEYGATHEAQVNVTITGVNDAPVANSDNISLFENESQTFNPADNDTDVDLGDTRRVTSVTNPTSNFGTAILDPVTAYVTYTTGSGFDYLAEGEQATEIFTYTVEDRFNGTDQGDVIVTVTGVNDTPEAVNDVQYVNEDSSKVFDPTLNDRDIDNGDVLHLASAHLNSGAREKLKYLPMVRFIMTLLTSLMSYLRK